MYPPPLHYQTAPLQTSRYQQPVSGPYYPSDRVSPEAYTTPSHSRVKPATYGQAYGTPHAQSGESPIPLLTSASLTRSYDTAIPHHFAATEARWQVTPDKRAEASASKRKRSLPGKDTPTAPSSQDSITPKRSAAAVTEEGDASSRPVKRAKTDEQRTVSASAPPVVQLPTPPSTGKHSTPSLPTRAAFSEEPTFPVHDEDDEAYATNRSGLIITRHQEEGRKLVVAAGSADEAEPPRTPEAQKLSPRTSLAQVIHMSGSGLARLGTEEVLQSEMAWIAQATAYSSPSSPDLTNIRTPMMSSAAGAHDLTMSEAAETPATRAERIAKRLEAFAPTEPKRASDEPMVCTRIDTMGRMALRKEAAQRFLALGTGAVLVEETREDEDDEWVERSAGPQGVVAGPSNEQASRRPVWPDELAPWSLAGGSRKARQQREAEEKALLLRRYLEASSDESSDEEERMVSTGKGKGKSVLPIIHSSLEPAEVRRRRPFNAPSADARDALAVVLRHRPVPVYRPPPMQVACLCGDSRVEPADFERMINCSHCQTWHHLECNRIDEESLPSQWLCGSCEAIMMSTPLQSTPSLSHERSSAFKGEHTAIALAPSPMFLGNNANYTGGHPAKTPMTAAAVRGSPMARPHRARILSYGQDMWSAGQYEDPAAVHVVSHTPSTPAPSRPDRFSTPRLDEVPFDVTSTPSRHLDFNLGQPSLFSLTPLGPGRGRNPSAAFADGTPFRPGATVGAATVPRALSSLSAGHHDFLRDLHKPEGHMHAGSPGGPGGKWPLTLMGAHNVSPSPFGHKRSISGSGRMSSMRSSSRSGLMFGAALGQDGDE